MDDFEKLLNNLKKSDDYLNANTPLPSDQKERILNQVLTNISNESSNKSKGVLTLRKFKKKFPLFIAAALCCSVITFGAATFFHIKKPLADSLHVTKKEAESIPVGAADLIASSTKDNITVNATQVIGDQYGFYVLLEITSPRFKDAQIDFEETDLKIDGVETMYWDFTPTYYDHNTVYAIVNVRTPENLINKKINLSLNDLVSHNEKISDKWQLSWDLNYQDVSKEFAVNQPVSLYGGSAVLNSVYVSPLSVYITLTEKDKFDIHSSSHDDTITVKLHDGTTITSNSDNSYNDVTVQGIFLGRLTRLSDIESVSFAGVEIPISSRFNVTSDGTGSKLVVSDMGACQDAINKLLAEDSTAIKQAFDLTKGKLEMKIDYDYQEPCNRLIVTYTGNYTDSDKNATSYYVVSDFDLQTGKRRDCSSTIDLSLIKEALHSGQFELKGTDNSLKDKQKEYITHLSDQELDTLLSTINLSSMSKPLTLPQTFMIDNEDTLLLSLPVEHALGDHAELVIMPQ